MRTRFGPFAIDSETRQLLSRGRDIHLSPKAFDLLSALIETRPRVLDKADLRARIWPNTHVVDANLNVLIVEIRRALGDSAQDSKFIRTVHGVGFAFCGTAEDDPAPRSDGQARFCWLLWNGNTYALAEGDNLIGRDPQCDVWLDADGVSRRHAVIRVDSRNRRVRLEDLGSTNGTFVGRAAVEGEIALSDGDVIQAGTVDLTVRVRASDTLPETRRIGRRFT